MATISVYRIVHKDTNKGFYQGLTNSEARQFKALFGYNPLYAQPHQPGPYTDRSISGDAHEFWHRADRANKIRYGFDSKAALLNWFSPEELMFIFSTLNCRLRRYQIDSTQVFHYEHQIIFVMPDEFISLGH